MDSQLWHDLLTDGAVWCDAACVLDVAEILEVVRDALLAPRPVDVRRN